LALVLGIAASAQAAVVINSVAHRNTDTDATEEPLIGPNPLDEGELVFNDRTHIYADVPPFFIGADYVMLANDNKNHSAYELDITFSRSATLYVFVDNRTGGAAGGKGVDPIITGMPWLTDLGFIDTGEDIGIDESADGSINQYFSIFALDVSKGTVTIGGCTQGHSGNMYGVAAILRISDPIAQSPVPNDGATDVERDARWTWIPGKADQTHNVFLGDTFQDVNSATTAAAVGLDVNAFDPGRLEFGQTYYWRVDEVNSTPDKTVFRGEIWSFEVEPYSVMVPVDVNNVTASSFSPFNPPQTTVNGSGLNGMTHSSAPETMWLSNSPDLNPWLMFEFDQMEKLDQMLVWNSNSTSEGFVGWGVKDATIEYSMDGVAWTPLADAVQISRAPGDPTYSDPQAVDLGLIQAKYVRINILNSWGGLLPQFGLAEVRFYALPTRPRTPNPASGAQGVDPRTDSLSWRAGREADQHDVYVSEDPNAMGAPQAVTENALALSGLNLALDTTYYWQVDEVNEAQVPSIWTGDLWNFTTVDSFAVDDFESYNNLSPDRPFQHWLDGYGYSADEYFPVAYNGNGTGAGIGHDIWSPSSPYFGGDLMETGSTAPGSGKALPFYYNNTAGVASETQHKFATAQDWTVNGLQTLSIAFRGTGGNTGTLYAKINSVKIPYDLAATDIGLAAWQAWNIDLTKVSGLKNVTTLSIGVDGSGASGMILLDDIRLYAKPGELITPVAPNTSGLLAQYSFEGNANDVSGHGLNGSLTPVLATIGTPGAAGQGSSVQLQLGGYVDLGNPAALNFGTGDWTIAAWFKTSMSGTGDANKGTIVAKGGDSTGGHRYALILSETVEGVISLVTDDDVTKVVVDSSTPVNDGQWHFVVGQREGTDLRLFIDGQVEATGTTANAATQPYSLAGTSQHNAYIGAVTNHASATLYKMFNGSIDNVAMYGRALSAEEILWLAGRTTPIHKPF
jgi:hypothetical protein